MNPFDKYNSESELPRLTDDIIKKKLKSMLRMSMGTFLMVLFSALVTGALLTGTAMWLKNGTVVGRYPVVCWLIVIAVWLTAAGFIICFSRDFWKAYANYRAPYHIVKAKLISVSRDEFQGMVWERRMGHYYRESVYSDEFCFDGMENFPVTKGTSDRANVGDEYFIVVFDKRPTKPVFIFHTDAYRWP